jgi:hypothetical protein
MTDHAAATRVGIRVVCTTCGRMKKPLGRSGPLQGGYCDDDCRGYRSDPTPGDLWPGETDAEFGYSCTSNGTEPIRERPMSVNDPPDHAAAVPAAPLDLDAIKRARDLVGGCVTVLDVDLSRPDVSRAVDVVWFAVPALLAEVARQRSAIQELQAALLEARWQPIETHDGGSTPVLITEQGGDVVEAWFSEERQTWWEINSYDDGSPGSDRRVYPTHWMPLPDPPAGDARPQEPREMIEKKIRDAQPPQAPQKEQA